MIDNFLKKLYNANTYNCAHFVADVFKHETGRDITEALDGFLLPPKERRAPIGIKNRFHKLKAPQDQCIVLMSRARTCPHVGLFLRGKVIHLTETSGAQFMPLEIASLGFTKVRFYTC